MGLGLEYVHYRRPFLSTKKKRENKKVLLIRGDGR
jgi:hypothetical protein